MVVAVLEKLVGGWNRVLLQLEGAVALHDGCWIVLTPCLS